MTIRHLPDFLKQPRPVHPTAEGRMRSAMGMPPPRAPGLPAPPPENRPLTPEQDLLQGWLRHRCGWR